MGGELGVEHRVKAEEQGERSEERSGIGQIEAEESQLC